MAHLQVKDINDDLYDAVKHRAALDHRSVSQEIIQMIKTCLSQTSAQTENATKAFLALSGSWDDDRDASVIVKEIRTGRSKNRRFRKLPDVFT